MVRRSMSTRTSDIIQGPSLLRTSLHRPAPSLVYMPGLRSLPFWTQWENASPHTTTTTRVAYQDPALQYAVQYLEEHYPTMAEEYHHNRSILPPASDYHPSQQENEHHTLHTGQWDWHSFLLKGNVQQSFGQQFPATATILQTLQHEGLLFTGIPFGYAFVSTLYPHSTIAAHTSPINFRLRVHLPIMVPPEPTTTTSTTTRPACGIRVGPTTRTWTEGKVLILDDSYEHEVWNDTSEKRVLLLVDLWHPDVTMVERKEIVAMFDHAHQQGWWSNGVE